MRITIDIPQFAIGPVVCGLASPADGDTLAAGVVVRGHGALYGLEVVVDGGHAVEGSQQVAATRSEDRILKVRTRRPGTVVSGS